MKGKDCVVTNRSIVEHQRCYKEGGWFAKSRLLFRYGGLNLPPYLHVYSRATIRCLHMHLSTGTDAFAARYITVHTSIFIKARTLPRV